MSLLVYEKPLRHMAYKYTFHYHVLVRKWYNNSIFVFLLICGFCSCNAPSVFCKIIIKSSYKHLENFLVLMYFQQVVHQEAFTYMGDQKQFVQIDKNDLYPYLLVNIGSGVGMIKVVIIQVALLQFASKYALFFRH